MFNANDDGAKRIRADWIGFSFSYMKILETKGNGCLGR